MADNSTQNEMVNITVDGVQVQAPKGAMLIEVTDAKNIKVPRFCYHKKLSISANCRMCLVEVEKAPKPMPACATPVMDGMVVHTQSQYAKDAQKSVMEFLLINHPLDCPICDQGGECELQDVAVAYGQDVSKYSEEKRVVFDKNIGPLIATELTRCIHCTRCVRFGREIAGIRELGMTGRGEYSLISTFMDECVNSELSGNVIDVCPVGALTAKPSRYVGRAWEMVQHKSIAPHDCIGSNIYIHTLRNNIVRVVPCENEAINEVWLSDRDRFSYAGLNAKDRLEVPKIKRDGQWQDASWEDALQLVAEKLKAAAQNNTAEKTDEPQTPIAAFVSPNATLEEQYLTQKLIRALGSGNIDHRLRMSDFADQDQAPVMPWLGQSIEQLEQLDSVLLIGSNIKQEQPIANLRLRKAVVNHNASVCVLNPRTYQFNYAISNHIVVAQQNMVMQLSAIASAVYEKTGASIPAKIKNALSKSEVDKTHQAIAQQLIDGEKASVILGNIAHMHPQFSALRSLAAAIAQATNSQLSYLTDGANSAGAWLAGCVPHRGAGGSKDVLSGKSIGELTQATESESLKACLLLNIEPDTDALNAKVLMSSLASTDFVVSISAYNSASIAQVADVILPAAAFSETSGTFVNIEGLWQSVNVAVSAKGQARPAWKILRVLANLLDLDGFDFMSSDEVKNEVKTHCASVKLSNNLKTFVNIKLPTKTEKLTRASDVPMYSGDAIVRRAGALQTTVDAQQQCLRLNPIDAQKLNLETGMNVQVVDGDSHVTMALLIDDNTPQHSAWMASAVEGNANLSGTFDVLKVKKAEASS